MKLEDLVPPVELCAEIPEGKFADSALVWWNKAEPSVYPREDVPSLVIQGGYSYPAPTLQEILEDMAVGDEIMESHSPELNYNRFCGGWIIRGRILNISVCDRIFRDWVDERDKNSPVTAALRLWLLVTAERSKAGSVTSEKSVKSEHTIK